MEDEGEIQIWAGLEKFTESVTVDIKSMQPRVDSYAFSLTAWVQQTAKSNGVWIIRKPLGSAIGERDLSCWGWHVIGEKQVITSSSWY
jgi:hypothetical protein